jgi:hypothetical protein
VIRGPRGYINLARNIHKNRSYQGIIPLNAKELVKNHFEWWSDINHINYKTFEMAISSLAEKPALIIETGTSAWGIDSTRLFDSYVRKYGGQLLTVDLRREAQMQLSYQLSKNSHCFIADSVEFLTKYNTINADLYYLDSFDLDLSNPFPSAEHGFNEFKSILENLTPGKLLLIDDTPSDTYIRQMDTLPNASSEFITNYSLNPGKGAFIKQYIEKNMNFELIDHNYSYLVKFI